MVINFRRYIKKENLLSEDDKILCTVSGGVDSMSLCSLLLECGYDVAIAHCNFELRGEESDGDEQLVMDFAIKRGLKFHSIHFQTKEYAKRESLSTQMAARELRYRWFEELCVEFGYNKIAVAHNAGDTIETFFINLIRSTGVEGMTGIVNCNGKIVRPLMFASRAEILKYAELKGVEYRTDSSNLSSKYLRNWIRLELMPKIDSRIDNFSSTMVENMSRIKSHNSLFDKLLVRVKSEVMTIENGVVKIFLSRIKEYGEDSTELLFQIIKGYGFTHRNVRSILLVEGSGRRFLAAQYRALIDRSILIISKIGEDDSLDNFDIEVEYLSSSEGVDYRNSAKNIAYICGEQIKGELKLRHWREGDRFIPLGMRGEKKVSDFLTDIKSTLYQKENQLVVVDENDTIVWVAEKRIDERCKIFDDYNGKIVKISYICKKK